MLNINVTHTVFTFAGASSGHDASLRPFADGSTQKLAEACRRFLINPGKDHDLRKWAAEGWIKFSFSCLCYTLI